jgi:hypothetical protein
MNINRDRDLEFKYNPKLDKICSEGMGEDLKSSVKLARRTVSISLEEVFIAKGLLPSSGIAPTP